MLTTEYVYTDSAGAVLGTITRMDNGSDKTFRASKGFPSPRPLYGLHQLAERPAAPVLGGGGREDGGRRAPSCFPTLWW